MEPCLVYMTASSADEAAKLAEALVGERLAACVNVIDGMTSWYRWEGAVQNERELVVLAKTRIDLVEALTARVKALHSYSVPCVVALPIAGGNADFLRWIAEETAGGAQGG
jgi:periplasmic divalent cation tolerance protein